jgi:hypothetical protein
MVWSSSNCCGILGRLLNVGKYLSWAETRTPHGSPITPIGYFSMRLDCLPMDPIPIEEN